MIMIQGAAQFVAAFLGTVAFSVLFSVQIGRAHV